MKRFYTYKTKLSIIGIIALMIVLGITIALTSKNIKANTLGNKELSTKETRHEMPKSTEFWTDYLGLDSKDIITNEDNSADINNIDTENVSIENIESNFVTGTEEEVITDTYSYQIEGVPSLLQYDLGLPTGCEGVSLTMCLLYNGYNVSAWDVCETYMPRDYNCTDPNVAFIGDPADGRCYGCNAPVIVQTALNIGASPVNLTGNLDAVYNEIINGHPVVIWGTDKWQPSWWHTCTMNGVDYFDWHGPFHCMCLTGFTDTTVTINDPYYGVTTVDKTLFETRWWEMGGMAVAVH